MTLRRTRSISRRAFVRGVLAIPVAGAAALVVRSIIWPGRPVAPAQRLMSIVSHRESAASVGREVLRSRPAETDAGVLLAALGATIPDLPRLLAEGSDDELRAAVDSASRRDFAEAGDGLIRINGWIASLTEARVCAIIAIA